MHQSSSRNRGFLQNNPMKTQASASRQRKSSLCRSRKRLNFLFTSGAGWRSKRRIARGAQMKLGARSRATVCNQGRLFRRIRQAPLGCLSPGATPVSLSRWHFCHFIHFRHLFSQHPLPSPCPPAAASLAWVNIALSSGFCPLVFSACLRRLPRHLPPP